MPGDAYWALGLGDSFVLVCPSLDIVAVRLGVGSVKSQLPGGDGPEEWGKRVAGFSRLVVAAAGGSARSGRTRSLSAQPGDQGREVGPGREHRPQGEGRR